MVFPRMKAVIFLNGCFWHRHQCRRGKRLPLTNRAYWRAKLRRNETRDAANQQALCQSGWSVLVVWECEMRDLRTVTDRVIHFLG